LRLQLRLRQLLLQYRWPHHSRPLLLQLLRLLRVRLLMLWLVRLFRLVLHAGSMCARGRQLLRPSLVQDDGGGSSQLVQRILGCRRRRSRRPSAAALEGQLAHRLGAAEAHGGEPLGSGSKLTLQEAPRVGQAAAAAAVGVQHGGL
jgi:hypothetical protein